MSTRSIPYENNPPPGVSFVSETPHTSKSGYQCLICQVINNYGRF